MIFFGGGGREVSIFSPNAYLHLGGTPVFRGTYFGKHYSTEYYISFRIMLTRPRHMVPVYSLQPHKGKVHSVTCHEGIAPLFL
jgi:hypothetical protein